MEEQLETEVKRKEEVINAMSTTLDDLMLKSAMKRGTVKTEREPDLETEVRKKEDDLQALSATLQQILSLTTGQAQEPAAVPGSVATEAKSLASALNQAMRATSSSPQSGGGSPNLGAGGTSSVPEQPWMDLGGPVRKAPQSPFSFVPDPGDPFAEIRMATQKLQNAQSVLQQSIRSRGGGGGVATSPSPARRPRAAKAKPRMYYV